MNCFGQAGLVLIWSALCAPLAVADTHFVSPQGSHTLPFTNWTTAATNIQAAVDVADAGDDVLVTDGTYRISEELRITNAIVLRSMDGPGVTIFDGQDASRCIFLSDNEAAVEGFAITHGGGTDRGAGVFADHGGTVRDCIIRQNRTDHSGEFCNGIGGGVCLWYGGRVENSVITGNGSGSGGGVCIYGGGIVSNCTIVGNTASDWGGGAGGGVSAAGGAILNCTILSNSTSYGPGGGICGRYTSIEGCHIEANEAGYGGGILCFETSTVRNCTITGNTASDAGYGMGGGVLCAGGSLLLASIVASNQTDALGGGIVCAGATIRDSQIADNTADHGGGVYAVAASLDVFVFGDSSMTSLENCTVQRNAALTNGGGAMCDSNVVIRGCNFSDNTAGLAGGGLCYEGSSVLDSHFMSNSALCGGGMFYGSLSNVVEAVSNLLENAAAFSNALASLNFEAAHFTYMLSDLATGQQTVPSPGTAGSPGCPKMMRTSCDLSLYSHVFQNCHAMGNTAVCGGGVFILNAPDAVFSNCVLAHNTAQLGGGLCVQNGGGIIESTLLDNEASLFGGGLFMDGAGLMLNCHVVSNRADMVAGGCGVGVFGAASIRSVTGTCSTVDSGTDSLRVLGSEFIGNSAEMMGGGLMLDAGSMATSNTFFRNGAYWGGGAANFGGELSESVLVENNAAFGAAILATGGETARCTVRYNVAEWTGGGIAAFAAAFGGSVLVTQCTVENNFAPAGGGIALVDSALVQRCTIASNTAGIAGGGAFTMLGGEIQSSLLHQNAAGDGGGVYCLNGGHVINNTITANDALNSGGGLLSVTNEAGFGWSYDTATVVVNSILYGNTASNAPNFLNLASNITYSHTCTFPFVPGTGNITNSPLLTPSGRLKSTSPCIDAGTASEAPPTDIDGEARWDHPGHTNVVSIVDIGADEFVDTDLDNMADYWETEAFGSVTNRDGTTDADSDALNDLAEYESSTTPTNSDTDADQMPDGWEVSHALNPMSDDANGDPDSDTMRNLGEYISDTDPHDAGSVLSLIRVDQQFGGIRLDWKGGREAWQILECRENLASTTEQWTAIFALPPPTALTNAVIDMGATNRALFYRIGAER